MSKKDIKVSLNIKLAIDQVFDSDFGLELATAWKKYFDVFTPADTGNLRDSADVRPYEIEYNADYSRYVYEGYAPKREGLINPIATKEWATTASNVYTVDVCRELTNYLRGR